MPLTPKALDLLLALLESRDRVLSKDELLARVWAGTVVEEGNLTQNVSLLRKALGDSKDERRYIVTVPGRGYRFVELVRTVDLAASPAPPAEPPAPPPAPSRWYGRAAIAAGAILLAAAVSYVPREARDEVQQRLDVRRLAEKGDVRRPVLSPDGEYVAFVERLGENQALSVRQLKTSSEIQLVPPAGQRYRGLAFSRDAAFLYFIAHALGETPPWLGRVPVLGGPVERVKDDVWGSLAFSPDGRRLAFVRLSPGDSVDSLVVADADGTREDVLTSRKHPETVRGLAWSPAGDRIAFSAGNLDTHVADVHVRAVPASGGAEEAITRRPWRSISGLAWLPERRGLLLVGKHEAAHPQQVWSVSYPAGEERRVSNDPNAYGGLSVDGDGAALVTSQSLRLASLWVVPLRVGRAQRISELAWHPGVSWAPDGRLVYAVVEPPGQVLEVLERDGAGRRRLVDVTPLNAMPAVSPDGRLVVFVSDRSGRFNLWRVDLAGGNLRPLTSGAYETEPTFSPDGNWVVYTSSEHKPSLWKVPIEGGAPVRLTGPDVRRPAVSRDGRLAGLMDDHRVVLLSLDGGEPRPLFDLPPTARGSELRWTPDGRSLLYVDSRDGVSNVWRRGLAGDAAQAVTDFKEDSIFYFDLAPDGSQLACVRGTTAGRTVLMSGF